MNNSMDKKSRLYRTGDMIYVNSSLGSPGPGWISINTAAQVQLRSNLGKLLGPTVGHWNTQASNFGTINTICAAAYGNGVWVAGGQAGVLRASTDDGVTWNTQTSNFTTTIASVAHGNGVWVAAGFGGTIRTSTDAINWNTQTSNFGTTNINAVAYSNGVWVAGGAGGTLRTSTNNAVNWNTQTSQFGVGGTIFSFAYGNGVWVAVGAAGALRTSTDRFYTIQVSTTLAGYTAWIKN